MLSWTMLDAYRAITKSLTPVLEASLRARLKNGKEIEGRVDEKKGITAKHRPEGALIWLHAASVGEAQSALILINKLLRKNAAASILVTTGTATSARLMEKNLPQRAFHQFAPWDHPVWVARFLNHWKPDFVLWMESELWPNMLDEIKRRHIPAALINARLSDKSYARWRLFKSFARNTLSAFSVIIAQTPEDAARFSALGVENVSAPGNLKFSAKPLPCDETELKKLAAHINGRPAWLFASTHAGEESMACRIHEKLKSIYPDILTIIAPRHPERRDEIRTVCSKTILRFIFRSERKIPPDSETDLYIADTMGELGLLYRLAPIACIGRSFSDDGGGGHNPIEASQLRCAVLHGPNVQFQQAIYDEMDEVGASVKVRDEDTLIQILRKCLSDPAYVKSLQESAYVFASAKEKVIERLMNILNPLLEKTFS